MTRLHWVSLLFWLCVVFALQGLSWAVLGSFDPFGIWDTLAGEALFGGPMAAEIVAFRRFILGPFGATDAGCFVLLAFVVRGPIREGRAWGHTAAAASLGTWFVIDCVASAAHAAYFNILLVNLPALVLLGLPLWMSRPSGPVQK